MSLFVSSNRNPIVSTPANFFLPSIVQDDLPWLARDANCQHQHRIVQAGDELLLHLAGRLTGEGLRPYHAAGPGLASKAVIRGVCSRSAIVVDRVGVPQPDDGSIEVQENEIRGEPTSGDDASTRHVDQRGTARPA